MTEDWKSIVIVIGGALATLRAVATLYTRRAENHARQIERDAKHIAHMKDQVDWLKALDDARALELARLRDQVLSAEVRRAQFEATLEHDEAELARLRQGVEACEREREDEQRRNQALAHELAELKRDIAVGRARNVTPIRPPKGER